MSQDPRDGMLPLPNHPIGYLLDREANPEMTAGRFRSALMLSALLTGNGIAEIERDGAGRPINLWPIDAARVEPRRDSIRKLFYLVNIGNGNRVSLYAVDVLHI